MLKLRPLDDLLEFPEHVQFIGDGEIPKVTLIREPYTKLLREENEFKTSKTKHRRWLLDRYIDVFERLPDSGTSYSTIRARVFARVLYECYRIKNQLNLLPPSFVNVYTLLMSGKASRECGMSEALSIEGKLDTSKFILTHAIFSRLPKKKRSGIPGPRTLLFGKYSMTGFMRYAHKTFGCDAQDLIDLLELFGIKTTRKSAEAQINIAGRGVRKIPVLSSDEKASIQRLLDSIDEERAKAIKEQMP